MIKISKLADYGTVILSHLAKTPEGQPLSASEVADTLDLPMPTVSKVLKLLNEAALVRSSRGSAGGYQLNRLPHEINVADIIRAIDGELAMTECSKEVASCIRKKNCMLRYNWQYINNMIVDMLAQLSLENMQRPLNKVMTLTEVERDLS